MKLCAIGQYEEPQSVFCTFIFIGTRKWPKCKKMLSSLRASHLKKYFRNGIQISFPVIYDLIHYFYAVTVFMNVSLTFLKIAIFNIVKIACVQDISKVFYILITYIFSLYSYHINRFENYMTEVLFSEKTSVGFTPQCNLQTKYHYCFKRFYI